jgi:hypothetical protein
LGRVGFHDAQGSVHYGCSGVAAVGRSGNGEVGVGSRRCAMADAGAMETTMNRTFAVLVAGGAIASAAVLTFNHAAAMPLGQFQALRAAADHTSLVLPARIICQTTGDYLAGWCEENCKKNSKQRWFESIYGAVCMPELGWPTCPPGSASLVASNGKTCCPQERLRTITSCTPVPSPNGADLCRVKLCGPADEMTRQKARKARNLDTDRYIVPAPRIGPPQPGLLERDSGFTRQAPGSVGTSLGTGAPSAPNVRGTPGLR